MNTKKICGQLNVTQKLLRTYEAYGLLSPAREENNYRDYSISDVLKIRCISLLRDFGFSYEQICTILSESGGKGGGVDQTFYIHLKTVDRKIRELEETKSKLKKCINDFLNSKDELGSALSTIVSFEGGAVAREPELPDFNWDFDNLADSYDENVISKSPDHQKALTLLRTYLLEQCVTGRERLLDVGCGSCYLWQGLEAKNLDITAMDNSLKMIICAKAKSPWLRFQLADILENDLDEGIRYDLVTSSFLLHHIPYKYQYTALENMLSSVEKRGELILVDRMFRDQTGDQDLRNYYIQHGEFRKFSDMATEFWPYADRIISYFTSLGCLAEAWELDVGIWMISVRRTCN